MCLILITFVPYQTCLLYLRFLRKSFLLDSSHSLVAHQSRSFQFAYHLHHSTETALVILTEDLLSAVVAGSVAAGAGLDLSAAFDTISHIKLCNTRFDDFGIAGTALCWLQSYLSNRSQFVKIRNSSSPSLPCTSAVPQGPVVGPLLTVLPLYFTYQSSHIQSLCLISLLC